MVYMQGMDNCLHITFYRKNNDSIRKGGNKNGKVYTDSRIVLRKYYTILDMEKIDGRRKEKI